MINFNKRMEAEMKNQATPKAPKAARKEPKTVSALQKSAPKAKKAVALDPAVKKLLKPRVKATTPKTLAPVQAPARAERTQLGALEHPILAAPTPAKLSDIMAATDTVAMQMDISAPPVVKMVTREVKVEQIPTYSRPKTEEKAKSSFQYKASEKQGAIKKFFQKIVDFLGK